MRWQQRYSAQTPNIRTQHPRSPSTRTGVIALVVGTVSRLASWLKRALTYHPPNRGELNDPGLERLFLTLTGMPTPSQKVHYEIDSNGSTPEDSHTEPSKTTSSDTTGESSSSHSGTTEPTSEFSFDEMMNRLTGGQNTEPPEDSQSPHSVAIFIPAPSSSPKDPWMELCSSSMDTAFVELLAAQVEYRERCSKSSLTTDEFDSMFAQIWTTLGTMQSRILLSASQMSIASHGNTEKT